MTSHPSSQTGVEAPDDVVAAMRPPAWLRRVPAVVWAVLAVAAVDVAVRTSWDMRTLRPGQPVELLWLGLRLAAAAAPIALLATVFVGPASRHARRALVAGAGCLAIAELGLLLLEAGVFPLDERSGDTTGALVVTVLRLVGPPLLALGLVRVAADRAPAEDEIFLGERSSLPGVVLLLGLVTALLHLGVTLIAVLALDPEAGRLPGPEALATAIVASFAPLAWSSVAAAALAGRGTGVPAWAWLIAGSMVLVASAVMRSVQVVATGVTAWTGLAGEDVAGLIGRFGEASSVLGVTGLLLLVVGFALGPGRPAAEVRATAEADLGASRDAD